MKRAYSTSALGRAVKTSCAFISCPLIGNTRLQLVLVVHFLMYIVTGRILLQRDGSSTFQLVLQLAPTWPTIIVRFPGAYDSYRVCIAGQPPTLKTPSAASPNLFFGGAGANPVHRTERVCSV